LLSNSDTEFINELYSGLYGEEPIVTAFENIDHYDGIVFEGNIEVKSQCSHHHMPFFGKAFIAYIPDRDGKIVGLSKLNRITEFFSRRPQVQENLTVQIHNYLDSILEKNRGVAVVIEAEHTCVSHRGARNNSVMKTTKLSGLFLTDGFVREELLLYIEGCKKV
jgi:GTP cyclohydrolase I